jgi:quinol monooxygenase YgiN
MGIVRVTGRLICTTPDDAALVRAHLPNHIALSRAEPGCLSFNVQPTDNPLVWRLDESFADQDALKAHQNRTRASDWFAKTSHIQRNFAVVED